MTVKTALDTFGKEAEGDETLDASPDAVYKIIGTDSVGAIAGSKLRNQAVTATLFGLDRHPAFHRVSIRLDVCGRCGYCRVSRCVDGAGVLLGVSMGDQPDGYRRYPDDRRISRSTTRSLFLTVFARIWR